MKDLNSRGLSYTYSAKEQSEIRAIREKYQTKPPLEESGIDRLRRLDGRVTNRATAASIVLGVLGTLVLGLGMSLVMSEFGAILGPYRTWELPLGIGIGLLGSLLVALAYPVYNLVLKQGRRRIAPEILRLTDELMK